MENPNPATEQAQDFEIFEVKGLFGYIWGYVWDLALAFSFKISSWAVEYVYDIKITPSR